MPQRVVHQAITEGHHAMGEVVLGQPRHHPLLLHVGPARHIDDEVAQVLPVPGERGAGLGVPQPPRPPSWATLSPCPASPYLGHGRGHLWPGSSNNMVAALV